MLHSRLFAQEYLFFISLMAFAFVASASGYCRLKMNSFMQLLLLLLLLVREAAATVARSITPVDNFLRADADMAGGGDDNRRRRPWADWQYDGHADVVPDDDGDGPEIWLRRAKKFGYAEPYQKILRRLCFYKGSIEKHT